MQLKICFVNQRVGYSEEENSSQYINKLQIKDFGNTLSQKSFLIENFIYKINNCTRFKIY